MNIDSQRRLPRAAILVMLAVSLVVAVPAHASRWEARQEFREGMREVARERREMRRDIMNAGSRAEARQAYREGQREIARERREMRREVRREVRHGRWHHHNHVGALVAGVAIGAVIASAARGVPPRPPSPDLCWFWSDPYQETGYWDYCYGY